MKDKLSVKEMLVKNVDEKLKAQMFDLFREYYDDVSREQFVVDLSVGTPIIPGFNIKLGISIVVNLEDKYLEFYLHIGPSFGYSLGPEVSLGFLENYNNPGDYREWFEYVEGGYWVGGGHCYGVDEDLKYINAVKAYYFGFSSPNVTYGRDYYYWNENLVIDWGN